MDDSDSGLSSKGNTANNRDCTEFIESTILIVDYPVSGGDRNLTRLPGTISKHSGGDNRTRLNDQ